MSNASSSGKGRLDPKGCATVSSSSGDALTAMDRSSDPKYMELKRRRGEGSRLLYERDEIVDSDRERPPESVLQMKLPRRGPRTPSRSSRESTSSERHHQYHHHHHHQHHQQTHRQHHIGDAVERRDSPPPPPRSRPRRRSASPPERRRTPEKIPYFLDDQREKDRLRRLHAERHRSRTRSPPPLRRPPSPPSPKRGPLSGASRRSVSPRTGSITVRHISPPRHGLRITSRNEVGPPPRRRRSSLSVERLVERSRRSSRSRSRSRDRDLMYVHERLPYRELSGCRGHERDHDRPYSPRKLAAPQIITIPVPVPEYSYAFSHWPPTPHHHGWLPPSMGRGGRHGVAPLPPPPVRYSSYHHHHHHPYAMVSPYRSPYASLRGPYGASRLFRPPARHFAPRPSKRPPFHRHNY